MHLSFQFAFGSCSLCQLIASCLVQVTLLHHALLHVAGHGLCRKIFQNCNVVHEHVFSKWLILKLDSKHANPSCSYSRQGHSAQQAPSAKPSCLNLPDTSLLCLATPVLAASVCQTFLWLKLPNLADKFNLLSNKCVCSITLPNSPG